VRLQHHCSFRGALAFQSFLSLFFFCTFAESSWLFFVVGEFEFVLVFFFVFHGARVESGRFEGEDSLAHVLKKMGMYLICNEGKQPNHNTPIACYPAVGKE
jgi:hypothetical protein